MTQKKIKGGYILLARNIIESEIWQKPPAYLKIWIYILSKVNWKASNKNPIGSEYFNFRQLKIPGVTQSQLYEFLRWAKKLNPTDSTTQITTEKTTRGTYLQVTKYAYYQDVKNYSHQNTFQQGYQQVTNTIPKTVIKREIINNLSLDEREILKNYVKRNKLAKTNLRGYVKKLIDNGDYLDILKEEKERLAKLELAKQQAEVNIPPEEIQKEDEKITRETMKRARAKVLQGLKGEKNG